MLIGIVSVAILIRVPLTEGRAANLDTFQVYSDPFILFGYIASIPFFVALYKAFRLLGYIGQGKAFSQVSINALKSIRNCALLVCGFIILGALYIRLFHHKDDDPAGFMAISIAGCIAFLAVATASSVFERLFQEGLDLRSTQHSK